MARLRMSTDHSDKLEEIRRVTRLPIRAHKIIAHGGESVVIDVDDAWMFRFPRASTAGGKLAKYWDFLASFATRSPLAIPNPTYVTGHFVGYRKIPGTPLYPSQIARLRKDDRRRVAKQLGLFLAALHRENDERIDQVGGYLGAGRVGPRPCPPDIAPYLSASECTTLEAKLRTIAENPLNLAPPTTVVHGDFYGGNILWDREKKVVTGIIDWSSIARGIPALDFTGLASFHTTRNDDFLRTMLAWYGAPDDGMFHQIKECSVIEAMNWFWAYQHRGNPKGMAWAVAKLKRVLSS